LPFCARRATFPCSKWAIPIYNAYIQKPEQYIQQTINLLPVVWPNVNYRIKSYFVKFVIKSKPKFLLEIRTSRVHYSSKFTALTKSTSLNFFL
jgi:hypothetical protein